jgi:hypothetical protein
MGAGEVFVEMPEKKQLPDFWFFGRSGNGAWPSQKMGPGEKVPKNYNSEINNCRPVINSLEPGSHNGNPG